MASGTSDSLQTLAELSTELHRRTDAFAAHDDRLGYFTALYALMTGRVAAGISAARFDDTARMERLTIHFAARYLDALDRHATGRTAPACWEVSFRAARRWPPIILQHLLLGMNAHINFDLGIAAAEVAPGDELQAMRQDFTRINDLIAGLVDDVQARIASVSPWMELLTKVGGRTEDAVLNFSMRVARESAWDVAVQLSPMTTVQRAEAEEALDHKVADFAQAIVLPAIVCRLALLPIRVRERGSIAAIIAALVRDEPSTAVQA